MPLWMNRAGGIAIMRAQSRAKLGSGPVSNTRRVEPITKELAMQTTDRVFTIPAATGDEAELTAYFDACPILDRKTTNRVHMQVVIVYSFYTYPDITNKELTRIITGRFPQSNWSRDADGRATVDRRKYNQGLFRCMGGWQPESIEDEHYAIAFDPRKDDDDEDAEDVDDSSDE